MVYTSQLVLHVESTCGDSCCNCWVIILFMITYVGFAQYLCSDLILFVILKYVYIVRLCWVYSKYVSEIAMKYI